MATKDPFEINIADLDEVRSKLVQVEEIVEEKRELVSLAQREFAYWQGILDRLRLVTGQPARAVRAEKLEVATPSAVEVVVTAINQSAVPLRASDVESRLTDPPARKTISWALWKAHKDQRIGKLSDGLYASLDYVANSNGQGRLDET